MAENSIVVGNGAAEIIKELGEEHLKTGFPIVYTSADSVFQIAVDINVIPLETLYFFPSSVKSSSKSSKSILFDIL